MMNHLPGERRETLRGFCVLKGSLEIVVLCDLCHCAVLCSHKNAMERQFLRSYGLGVPLSWNVISSTE